VSVITVGVTDFVRRVPFNTSKKTFYSVAFIGIPLLVFIIYWSLLNGLSAMEIRQCLPYKEGDQPYTISPWTAIGNFAQMTWHTINATWWNKTFAVIINASGLYCIYLFAKNKLAQPRKTILMLSLSMLCLFCLFNFHEFLKSGVLYRSFWAQPLSMMIIFLLIDTATQNIPKIARIIRFIIFIFLAFLVAYGWFLVGHSINSYKIKSQYLSLPRGGIYLTNSPSWISTVEQTTDFLNKTLKPGGLFFALPYDCLYYYLTDRKTPTRQLIFFEHIKIPPEQERSVIAELEKKPCQLCSAFQPGLCPPGAGTGFFRGKLLPLDREIYSGQFHSHSPLR